MSCQGHPSHANFCLRLLADCLRRGSGRRAAAARHASRPAHGAFGRCGGHGLGRGGGCLLFRPLAGIRPGADLRCGCPGAGRAGAGCTTGRYRRCHGPAHLRGGGHAGGRRLPVHVSGARPGHLVGGLHDAGCCQPTAADCHGRPGPAAFGHAVAAGRHGAGAASALDVLRCGQCRRRLALLAVRRVRHRGAARDRRAAGLPGVPVQHAVAHSAWRRPGHGRAAGAGFHDLLGRAAAGLHHGRGPRRHHGAAVAGGRAGLRVCS